MKIKFAADKIICEVNTEHDYYLVGFSDNGDEPDQYVLLQRATNLDEQDIELGLDTYYFEYSDQSYSGYGICKDITLDEGRAYFELEDVILDESTTVEITFDKSALSTDWLYFKTIFNNIVAES